jgi:hypothetical protein
MVTPEQFNEAVLDVTGGPSWDVFKKGLESDIYNIQAQALTAERWEEVCELRGFAKGLAFIMNIRENTKQAMVQNETLLSAENAPL